MSILGLDLNWSEIVFSLWKLTLVNLALTYLGMESESTVYYSIPVNIRYLVKSADMVL